MFLGRYRYIEREEGEGNFYVALELSEPQAVDAATYRLNARNQFGESNANLKLNFDGKYLYLISLWQLEFSFSDKTKST